jgi:hypothetical protein
VAFMDGNLVETDRLDAGEILQVDWRERTAGEARPPMAFEPIIYLSAWGERDFAVPVKIELELGEDGFIAFSPTLDMGGGGLQPAAAIEDLMISARELYENLGATAEEELHPTARATSQRLRKFFE